MNRHRSLPAPRQRQRGEQQLHTYESSIGELHDIVTTRSPIGVYIGATRRPPEKRCYEHEREGKTGLMYFAKTTNMKHAETRLITSATRPKYNQQQQSGMPETKGFVYVIVGTPQYYENDVNDLQEMMANMSVQQHTVYPVPFYPAQYYPNPKALYYFYASRFEY
jgi:hypothetical protein